MSSDRPDLGGDYDFQGLLNQGQAELHSRAGASSPAPRGAPPPSPEPRSSATHSGATADLTSKLTPRRQLGSRVSLLLILLGAAAIGTGSYGALNSIQISSNPFDQSRDWATLLLVGIALALVALIVAIVALFRSRPKLLATLSTVLCVLLPPFAIVAGIKFGVDAFTDHAREAMATTGSDVAALFAHLMREAGVAPEPFMRWIELFLG